MALWVCLTKDEEVAEIRVTLVTWIAVIVAIMSVWWRIADSTGVWLW